MKILAWNCQMAFRKKYSAFQSDLPVICVISESESPEKMTKLPWNQHVWIGDSPHKGLGIFSTEKFQLERHPKYTNEFRHILPVKVRNIQKRYGELEEFIIIGVWTKKNEWCSLKYYIGDLYLALLHYKSLLAEPILIMGDFNWNRIWDDNPGREIAGTLIDVINLLKSFGIHSVYHEWNGYPFGNEPHPTLYHYRHKDMPFHNDYIFASQFFRTRIQNFRIGRFEEWNEYSDHMPLIMKMSKMM